MIDIKSDTDIRVTVWIREDAPTVYGQSDLVSRLHRLQATGLLSDVSIRIWGKRLTLDPNDIVSETGKEIRLLISAFEHWADQNGLSLESAFRRHSHSPLVSKTQQDIITLPVICLAVYDRGRLIGVFPCSNTDHTSTVEDCVAQLEEMAAETDTNVSFSSLNCDQ